MTQVLSLIAAPEKTPLTDETISTITKALRSNNCILGEGCWLSDGEAWECPLDQAIDRAMMEELAADWPIDINLVPLENRRKRLLIADMDSTVIQQECIDELAEVAGVGEEIRAITAVAMRGELEFEQAMRERVQKIAGLEVSAIDKVINERITFTKGGKELTATMKANGALTALISGGFTQFTAHIADLVGFQVHQANELLVENGQLTGKVREPVLGQAAKVEALNRHCGELGITPEDVLTVGDGANDIAMLKAAGMGVALHAKPAVREAARYRIDHGDLTALLFLQGYTRTEFSTA